MDQQVQNRIAVLKNFHLIVEGQLTSEKSAITRHHRRIEGIRKEAESLAKAVALIDKSIEVVSANGIGKIESIVSAGMHKVFNDPTLGLVIEKKETASGYSYRIQIRHGDTIGNPMESFGGGIQNVAAFLLRVILIRRFGLSKLMVIDEGFNNVSSQYLPNVSDMLKTLSEDYGYTILAITHQPALAKSAQYIYEVIPSQPPRLKKKSYQEVEGSADDQFPSEVGA